MSKGLPRSLSRGNPIAQRVIKQTVKASALSLTMTGASGVGWGTAVLGDFPAGNIMLLGAVSYMQFTTASASVTDTYDGDYSIGTTATTDATLSTTDANIIPSTALGAATAKVSPVVRGVQADGAFCGVVLDNTDGSLELNLNMIIDDANISANSVAVTATGYVVVSYIVLADD